MNLRHLLCAGLLLTAAARHGLWALLHTHLEREAADRIPELVETRRLHADEIGRLRQQPRDLVKCSIGQHLGWPFRSHGRDLGHTKQTRTNDGLTSAHYAAADRCASRAGWWLEPRLRVGGTLSEAVYAAVGRTTHLAASRRLARSRSDIQPRHASPTGG